jgi:hypothetical protein
MRTEKKRRASSKRDNTSDDFIPLANRISPALFCGPSCPLAFTAAAARFSASSACFFCVFLRAHTEGNERQVSATTSRDFILKQHHKADDDEKTMKMMMFFIAKKKKKKVE